MEIRLICVLLVVALAAHCSGNHVPALPEIVINDYDPLFLARGGSLHLNALVRAGKGATAEQQLLELVPEEGDHFRWVVLQNANVEHFSPSQISLDPTLTTASAPTAPFLFLQDSASDALSLESGVVPDYVFDALPATLDVTVQFYVANNPVPLAEAFVQVRLLSAERVLPSTVPDTRDFFPAPDGFLVGISAVCGGDSPVACRVLGRTACVESAEACSAFTRGAAGLTSPLKFISTEFEIPLTEQAAEASSRAHDALVTVAMPELSVEIPANLAMGHALHVRTRAATQRFSGVTASPFFADLVLVKVETGELLREFGDQEVALNFAVIGSERPENMQLGFFSPGFTRWDVADPVVDAITRDRVLLGSGSGLQAVRTTTSHFTSFAVLVAGGEGGNDDNSPFEGDSLVIYILSGVTLLLVVFASIVVVLLVLFVKPLNSYVLPRGSSKSTVRQLRSMRERRSSAYADEEAGTEVVVV